MPQVPTNGNGPTRSACPRARPNGRSSGFAGGALVPFRAAAARGRRAPSYCNLHMVRAIGPPPFRGAKRVARVSDVANSDQGVHGTGHPEASVQRLLAGGSGRRTRRARAHSAATIWPGDRHAAERANTPSGQTVKWPILWPPGMSPGGTAAMHARGCGTRHASLVRDVRRRGGRLRRTTKQQRGRPEGRHAPYRYTKCRPSM